MSFHCSEGNRGSEDNVVAYYLSEFDVPIGRGSAVDEAIGTMDPMEGSLKGRMGKGRRPTSSLLINNVMSGGTVKGEHHSAFGCEKLPILLYASLFIKAYVNRSFCSHFLHILYPSVKKRAVKGQSRCFYLLHANVSYVLPFHSSGCTYDKGLIDW